MLVGSFCLASAWVQRTDARWRDGNVWSGRQTRARGKWWTHPSNLSESPLPQLEFCHNHEPHRLGWLECARCRWIRGVYSTGPLRHIGRRSIRQSGANHVSLFLAFYLLDNLAAMLSIVSIVNMDPTQGEKHMAETGACCSVIPR